MQKKSMLSCLISFAVASLIMACLVQLPLPAYAAAQPSAHYSVDRFSIGALLANPRTRAVVNQYLPGFSATQLAEFARHETLKEAQDYDSGLLTNTVLTKINAALANIPANAVAVEVSQPPNGQTDIPNAELDPARALKRSQLEAFLHRPLPEQYIWTHSHAAHGFDLKPHYFRGTFDVTSLPTHATLYLAGPRQASIYLNGQEVGHYQENPDAAMNVAIRVYEHGVTRLLRTGKNVLAIEAVRGFHSGNEAQSTISRQLRVGKVLAVMIVPAARGIQAPPVMMSNANWRATARRAPAGWQRTAFDDSAWRKVDDLGGIESAIGLFQANADAGMYAWPGYQGISPFLAQFQLNPMEIRRVYAGIGMLKNVQALAGDTHGGPFTVSLPAQHVAPAHAPQVMLDFGREVSGRIELQSESNAPSEVTVQYGESAAEALLQPYLGVDSIYIPPHGTAYGPKSAFRYVVIRFTGGRSTPFRTIRLDGIAYPVKYLGSFQSSSPLLNKMWTIGAYTAHLCMQDDIWDAPKRDRNRWAGDLDVSGRTIDDVFGNNFLMQTTLNRLLGPAPIGKHVNEIPGYSALWVNTVFNYYLHTGSKQELETIHPRLVELLSYMEKDLNRHALFSDLSHGWPFVDWSPGMHSYDRQTRMATQFEYYQAFKNGAYLLRVLHDDKNAKRMAAESAALKAAAQRYMLGAHGTFGGRWQPNAYAVLSGVANSDQYATIWHHVLSQVGKPKYLSYVITPYYNFYVVTAMAKMGHRHAALEWIRKYWGGMVKEGATSFWEGYNPTWFKGFLYQANLQADDQWGFHVSLAHGWSSGVTPWLMRQVLGIRPTAGGFARVDIRPDLIGLKWAKGAEPTPHGLLRVAIRDDKGYITTIHLPPQVQASVSVPISTPDAKLTVNGRPMASVATEGGRRAVVRLSGPGKYVVTSH